MNSEPIYVLNPDYILRRDNNRVIITNRYSEPGIDDFMGFMHPIHAVILSFFNGENHMEKAVGQVAQLTGQDTAVIQKIVQPMLDNEDALHFHYENRHFSFPKRILVKKGKSQTSISYNPREFFIPKAEMDLDTRRLNSPLDILFMVNTRCFTDCLYCYADRSREVKPFPMERLRKIIKEARRMNMRSFDLTGGDFFLYAQWETLLEELTENGFFPYISTKYPVDLDIIKKLKKMGINRLQVSIDSIVKEELIAILKVKEDYYHQIRETFRLLDENGMEINTNTQLTALNTSNFESLLGYLLGLKNIKSIRVGVAGPSLYKPTEDYQDLKPSIEEIKRIENYVQHQAKKYKGKVDIGFSGYTAKDAIVNPDKREKVKRFSERSQCSANFYGFIILPDGKVTICEELYWHPSFIIGDLTCNSIEEVWSSEKALELFKLSQDKVSKESACRTCNEFDLCHQKKGVCWKEVLYAYGNDKWDFPDPKCPYAPEPHREYYV